MILTDLQSTERIENLHPLFKTLFDYVKTHDLLEAPIGRIVLDGDNLFINNDEAICRPIDKQVMEIHRKYIDVQIVLEGEESVGWKPLTEIQHISKEYDEERDFELNQVRFIFSFPRTHTLLLLEKAKFGKLSGKLKYSPN